MVTNIDAVGKIGKSAEKYSSVETGNTSGENAGLDYLTKSVKSWIIVPLLCFHIAGFCVLLYLTFMFFPVQNDVSQWTWPVLIGAFAGLPFAFASNIKMLVGVLTYGN